jgi:hypothetical protein
VNRKLRQQRRALADRLDQGVAGIQPSEELSMLLHVAEGLIRLWKQPVPEPPTALRPGRSRYMTHAASGPRVPNWHLGARPGPAMVLKLAASLTIAVAVLVPMSGGVVRAARDSAPGNLLYPLKIHVERVQYAGADNPDVRVALALAFLGERVAESQETVYEHGALGEVSPAEVQQLSFQLLRAIAETPDATLPDVLDYARLQLDVYLRILIALEPIAGESNVPHIAAMLQACRRAYLITGQALNHPTEFQTAYRAGRPELFLLPGERPLNGEPAMTGRTSTTQSEMPL